jgi:branched-chain amino acid transport system substrate-binding protein
VGAGGIFAPSVLKAQQQPIKLGHLIPQSGFLSPMGEYMIKAASLAVEEINEAGGVLGRKLQLIPEDDMNPGVAVLGVKLLQQEKVDALLGTVSGAVSGGDGWADAPSVVGNTGSSSDEIREAM